MCVCGGVIHKLASCCVDLVGVIGCFVLLVVLHLFAWLWCLVNSVVFNISLFGCCLLAGFRELCCGCDCLLWLGVLGLSL